MSRRDQYLYIFYLDCKPLQFSGMICSGLMVMSSAHSIRRYIQYVHFPLSFLFYLSQTSRLICGCERMDMADKCVCDRVNGKRFSIAKSNEAMEPFLFIFSDAVGSCVDPTCIILLHLSATDKKQLKHYDSCFFIAFDSRVNLCRVLFCAWIMKKKYTKK